MVTKERKGTEWIGEREEGREKEGKVNREKGEMEEERRRNWRCRERNRNK